LTDLGAMNITAWLPSRPARWWAQLAFTRLKIELTILQEEIEELMNVKGIGEKSFLKLKLITVGGSKPATEQ
jgi:hypothetical protein